MLSIGLAACSQRHVESAPPPPAVVTVDPHVAPPADLIACPKRPEGFPLDQAATLPPAVREAAIRLATSYAGALTQLERLIGWETGTLCKKRD